MSGARRHVSDVAEHFLSREACKALFERIVALGVGGGSTAVSIVSNWRGTSTWARNRVYVSSDNHEVGVSITRTIQGAGGSASTTRTDDAGLLTDVPMPAEGTEAHATLLVAEYLARCARDPSAAGAARLEDIEVFVASAREQYGRYWRKSAREPGGERELAAIAVGRLEQLQLVRRNGDELHVLPALARFSLGDVIVAPPRQLGDFTLPR